MESLINTLTSLSVLLMMIGGLILIAAIFAKRTSVWGLFAINFCVILALNSGIDFLRDMEESTTELQPEAQPESQRQLTPSGPPLSGDSSSKAVKTQIATTAFQCFIDSITDGVEKDLEHEACIVSLDSELAVRCNDNADCMKSVLDADWIDKCPLPIKFLACFF